MESEQPEDKAIADLREHLRIDLNINRSIIRQQISDSHRIGFDEISSYVSSLESITAKDVSGLAGRIKRRKHADCDDLVRLSLAFLQSPENIKTFLNITGALNVVIKELSGNDSDSQILACECLCNLSLGSDQCCHKMSKQSLTYLLLLLDSPNGRLSKTSIWVIQNLAASGDVNIKSLLSHGVLSTLGTIVKKSNDVFPIEDCLLAFDIILSRGKSLISQSEIETIFETIVDLPTFDTPHLISVLYSLLYSFEFKLSNQSFYSIILEKIFNSFESYRSQNDTYFHKLFNIQTLLYMIRICANIISLNDDHLSFLIVKKINIIPILNRLFSINNIHIFKELIWFLGTIFRAKSIIVHSYLIELNVVEELRVLKYPQVCL